MNRSPIYQTFSTRVLVPVRRRRHWPLALGVAAFVALVLAALALGRGLDARQETFGAKPAPAAAPVEVRSDLLRRYAEQEAQPAPTDAPAVPATATAARSVGGTGGVGLLLRAAPGLDSAPLKTLAEAAPVDVIGEEVIADGLTWAPVRDAAGVEGWVATDYLQPA